ncbi:MAG: fructose-6-phosphate aldolase [bacterium]
MKFFLDTAEVDEIKRAKALGLLDGVTTNPSLVTKSTRSFDDVVKEILEIVDGPVSLEVTATDTKGMISEGHKLSKLGPQVVVKIPMIPDGIVAVRELTNEGIKVNVTLCFQAVQALIAAKAGATYISPFIGRLDDVSTEGMDVIEEIRTIYDNYGLTTQILAASLRHPLHVKQAALLGADVATMPFKVLEQLFNHPLTDLGLAKFLADWEKRKK